MLVVKHSIDNDIVLYGVDESDLRKLKYNSKSIEVLVDSGTGTMWNAILLGVHAITNEEPIDIFEYYYGEFAFKLVCDSAT